METMTATRETLAAAIKTIAQRATWHVLTVEGYTFKIISLWAQIKQAPNGNRDSGTMYNKSQKALVKEILDFMGAV